MVFSVSCFHEDFQSQNYSKSNTNKNTKLQVTFTPLHSRNHLKNICCHESDFGIKVISYNFFATSHGKTENDGHGGIVKRTARRHCLRSSPEEQITNPLQLYEFGVKQIKSIRY